MNPFVRMMLVPFLFFVAPMFGWAQYPDRPVKVIVPWPAGATTDAIARIFADQLADRLKGSVVVENRAGANAIVGTNFVARSAPDGLTLLFTTSEPISINPYIYKSVPYDVWADLEPIAFVGKTYFVMAARADFPASDIQQMIALAKKQPRNITVGTYGIATLFLGSFEGTTETQFTSVPFQGAGPAVNAIMGSHVDLTMAASFSAAQYLKSGKIKMLGVGSAKRLAFMPQVPTFLEQGIDFQIGNWLSVFGPKGLPTSVSATLQRSMESIVTNPTFVERARSMGVEAEYGAAPMLAAYLKSDNDRWAKVVREKNIKAE